MNLLSKKLIMLFVILGIVSMCFIIGNNRFNSVNGATVTSTPTSRQSSTPTRQITPTPTRPRATPTKRASIVVPTIPPGVTVTYYIEKVSDAAEGGKTGQFRIWLTQTGPTTVDGYLLVYYTLSGSATHMVDYTGRFYRPLEGYVRVKAGDAPPLPTADIPVDGIYIFPLGDDLIEGTETVTVTLKDVNVGAGMGSATLNIADGPIVTPRPTVTSTPTRRVTPTPTRPETPPPTQPVTPTRPVTPTLSVPGKYVVIYTLQSDWGNGATISVTIKNNNSFAVSGWTLAWTFPGNQTITNMWNATFTQSGASVSVKDGGFNSTIPGNGGSVNFGFNLNYSGSNLKPTSFTLNGTPCVVQ